MPIETKEVDSIKYVSIELLPKTSQENADIINDLFCGIMNETPNVWIGAILTASYGESAKIKGFSLNHYSILSINISYNSKEKNRNIEYSEFTIFNKSEEDQNEARKILNGVLESLKAENKMLASDPTIVDIDKYTDVPYSLKNNKSNIKSIKQSYTSNVEKYNTYGTFAYAAKIMEPTVIKRVSSLPDKKILEHLRRKILKARAGATDEIQDVDH